MRNIEYMSIGEKLAAGREMIRGARFTQQIAEIKLSCTGIEETEGKVWRKSWYYAAREEVTAVKNFIAPAKLEGGLLLTNIGVEAETVCQAIGTGTEFGQDSAGSVRFALRRIAFTKKIQRRLGVIDK